MFIHNNIRKLQCASHPQYIINVINVLRKLTSTVQNVFIIANTAFPFQVDCQVIKQEPLSERNLPLFGTKTDISSNLIDKSPSDVNDNSGQLIIPADLQSHVNSENLTTHFNLPDITNYFNQTSSLNDCILAQPTVYNQSIMLNNAQIPSIQSRLSHMTVDAQQNMELQNQIQRQNKRSLYG